MISSLGGSKPKDDIGHNNGEGEVSDTLKFYNISHEQPLLRSYNKLF